MNSISDVLNQYVEYIHYCWRIHVEHEDFVHFVVNIYPYTEF